MRAATRADRAARVLAKPGEVEPSDCAEALKRALDGDVLGIVNPAVAVLVGLHLRRC